MSSTTFKEATQAVLSEVYSLLASYGVSDSEIAFPNEKFDPVLPDRWFLVRPQHTRSEQETLGPVGRRRFRHFGVVTLTSFIRHNAGIELTTDFVELFRAKAETRVASNVLMKSPVMREGRRDTAWFTSVLEWPFEYWALQ